MIEIFKNQEIESIVDNNDEFKSWKASINELGMEGQQQIVEKQLLIPYHIVSSKMNAIIDALCPVYSNIKSFETSIIPLEVLDEIKNCKDMFSDIVIRTHKELPYAFILGKKVEKDKWTATYYLIAKYGSEEKIDWTRAYQIAFNALQKEWKAKLERRISLCKSQLERLDADITAKLSGEYINCEG